MPSRPKQRVCPECGEPPGAGVFCASCGINLSGVDRLPSAAEWAALHDVATQDDTAAPQELAGVQRVLECAACHRVVDESPCPSCGSTDIVSALECVGCHRVVEESPCPWCGTANTISSGTGTALGGSTLSDAEPSFPPSPRRVTAAHALARGRAAGIAYVLSVLLPGLGHFYLELIGSGLLYLFATGFMFILGYVLGGVALGTVLGFAFYFIVWLIALVDLASLCSQTD